MSRPRKKRNSGSYEVITVVIARLHPNMHLVGTVSCLLYRLLERLRPQLAILIELVLLTLHARQPQTYDRPNKNGTHDIDKHIQPRTLRHVPHQTRRIPLFALLHPALHVQVERVEAPPSMG